LLPASAREIESLVEVYRDLDVRALSGTQATPAKVLSSLGEVDIVHIAAHAEADLKDPALSHLVLASKESDSGALSSSDLLRLRLMRPRLVVLAACETNDGPVSPSEGALSLSSAFLAAGVPAVLGTLWQVDDQGAARFSVRFHQELRRGADALSALRAVQLEEIRNSVSRPGWTWASFQLLGGVMESAAGRH
jgi:CHAT domain-containing protein